MTGSFARSFLEGVGIGCWPVMLESQVAAVENPEVMMFLLLLLDMRIVL